MKIGIRLSAVAVGVAATTATLSAAAQLEHGWGILQKNDLNDLTAADGASILIMTDNMISSCNTLVTHEMWFGFDGAGNYWVEAGFLVGSSSAPSGCSSSPTIFWADSRPSPGGFNEHVYPSINWNWDAWYQVVISLNTPGDGCGWDVSVGGVGLGTSYPICPQNGGRTLSAGTEEYSYPTDFGLMRGWLANWFKRNSSGNWLNFWGGPIPGTFGTGSAGPPSMQFENHSGNTEEVFNESFWGGVP